MSPPGGAGGPAEPGTGCPAGITAVVDLYRTHEGRVRAFCGVHLSDPAAAEDATQETFIRAAPHLTGLRPEVVHTYLLSVARTVCADELRLRQRRHRTLRALRDLGRTEDPETIAAQRHAVLAVWSSLAPREKVLVVMRFAGYSYDEISRRLGMSTSAVGVALIRARRRVRSLFEDIASLPALLPWCWSRMARRRRGGGASAHRSWRSSRLPVASPLSRALTLTIVVAGAATLLAQAPRLDGVVLSSSPAAMAVGEEDLQDMVVTGVVAVGRGTARTVLYASGYRRSHCAARGCAVLLRSGGEGDGWHVLTAAGYDGGVVLASPPGVLLHTLFVSGPGGLQRSDDGGAGFRTVVAIPGPMAMLVDARTARVSIVIGSHPLWRYDVASGTLAQGPRMRDGVRSVDAMVTAPGGDRVLVADRRAAADGTATVVERCDLRSCQPVWQASGGEALDLAVAPPAPDVIAFSRHRAMQSDDGGATWVESAELRSTVEAAAVVGPRGAMALALHDATGTRLELASAAGVTAIPLPPSAVSVRWLVADGGRMLLGAGTPTDGGVVTASTGIMCSDDGGRSWKPGC